MIFKNVTGMYNFRRTEVSYFVKHLKVTNLTNNKFK